jgi:hypothetical protein
MNDEGLRSQKAIAFIQTKCSRTRLEEEKYSIVCKSPREATEFLKGAKFSESSLKIYVMKYLGDQKWTK